MDRRHVRREATGNGPARADGRCGCLHVPPRSLAIGTATPRRPVAMPVELSVWSPSEAGRASTDHCSICACIMLPSTPAGCSASATAALLTPASVSFFFSVRGASAISEAKSC
ncbi:hypothetical protein BRADI_5g17178v3 [Brachypodium distachyon]|uniref:Uncharacterized protein n=1 Tax=Brachypodium distachyon TaxID=15368 RepID=A0A2K2CHT1_BRADI|nr:hypothetical protein BRADI_5g17178v3 [Brachypodium distachyon]